jgi:hypothetical protein
MTLQEHYSFLVEFFTREKIDFALIGAFALHAYGYTRATRDVDFITRREAQTALIACMEANHFSTVHRSEGISNHLHEDGRSRIDILYVDDNTADQVFSSARIMHVLADTPLPVVSPEHLAAMKLFAMKNDPSRTFKEISDIRVLVHICGIDPEVIRHYLHIYDLERWSDDILSTDNPV